MDYISTRGGGSVTSAQAIASGLAPDGGLFLPDAFPAFSPEEIQAMEFMTYPKRALEVLSRFLPGFTREELMTGIQAAYAPPSFPEQTAPVVTLAGGLHVLELFRGPTCAFKDFALQLLPFLLTSSLRKTGAAETVVVLVATSGDTGKAALEGFADVDGTKICVFYPDGGTSEMQRLQMVTQTGDNVMVIAAAGNFDDAQNGVKAIFTDTAFAQKLKQRGYLLSSANSINWGRLAPQVAYYFSAYADLCRTGKLKSGAPINVTVPTGNFGNILAAYIAKCCGLPVKKLICASNKNKVLTDFIRTGTYDRNREFYLTTSPSMDILISSNLERLLYLLSGRNPETVRGYMKSLGETGKYTVTPETLGQIQEHFAAGYADDNDTSAAIGDAYQKYGYVCDPHTAVAIKVYEDYTRETGDTAPTVIASTASPFKFADTVLAALGHTPEENGFARLRQLSRVTNQKIPASLAGLEVKPARFSRVLVPQDMKQAVDSWLAP